MANLPSAVPLAVRSPVDDDRVELASLLLDAYRGTVDDEGEDEAEALSAIDGYLARIERDWSRVVEADDRLIALCFVVDVGGVFYVDPIAVASSRKSQGVGTALVLTVLMAVRERGVTQVGAVVTDGNTASERLFRRLGFTRVGAWG